jgi:hypothetical protein
MNGDRETSTVAPQALLLMNSELVTDLTAAMAERLLGMEFSTEERIERLFVEAYGRPPTESEVSGVRKFLERSAQLTERGTNADETKRKAWQMLCQSVVSSSEFVYVR